MISAIKVLVQHGRCLTENSNAARSLHRQGYGTRLDDGRIHLSPFEAAYLAQRGRVFLLDARGKRLAYARLLKSKRDWLHYVVFRALRDAGHKVKTGLKFGAGFRVYERNRQGHARWVVYPVREREVLTWHDFAAKNRVAHSVNKRLLIAVVDHEDDVSFWEVSWIREGRGHNNL